MNASAAVVDPTRMSSLPGLVGPAALAEDPLSAVRSALLADARADAERQVDEAHGEAARLLEEATARAEALLEAARSEGRADAEDVRRAELNRARRAARALVLDARRQAEDELRRRVDAAVAGLRDDAEYPAFLERVEQRARALLGADASLSESPQGGVVARSGGRRVAFTLDGLAAEVLEAGPG